MNSLFKTAKRVTTPTVSVVIPTYNRGALLINAMESVLKQTYTDYELIVIDDGSTDDTSKRLQPYMERIRYYYQDNRGASAAQNAGVRVAACWEMDIYSGLGRRMASYQTGAAIRSSGRLRR